MYTKFDLVLFWHSYLIIINRTGLFYFWNVKSFKILAWMLFFPLIVCIIRIKIFEFFTFFFVMLDLLNFHRDLSPKISLESKLSKSLKKWLVVPSLFWSRNSSQNSALTIESTWIINKLKILIYYFNAEFSHPYLLT